MATTISFTVPAIPIAQPRPQAVKFGNSARMHEKTHIKNADGTRKPHPINAFKATVAHAAQLAYSGPPLDCPLSLFAVFVFPRPQAMQWKTKAMPRAPHANKPDADNVFKALTDAMKGVVFTDDARLCVVTIEKVIAAGDEQPHCEVVISELNSTHQSGA